MDSNTQTILTAAVPTLAVLIGILVNNSRLSDLRAHMDARFGDMKETMDARFGDMKETMNARFGEVAAEFRNVRSELLRVEQVMDARIKHLEERR
jgi:hypothetical protein